MIINAIFDSYWYWFSAALLLLFLEILIPGVFLMWIGFGAAGVGVFLLLFPTAAIAWQLIALACSVTLAVCCGVAWQKRSLHKHANQLNQGLEGYVGRSAIVSESFVQGRGRIRLEDSYYTAYSDHDLQVGQVVTVIASHDQGLQVQPAN